MTPERDSGARRIAWNSIGAALFFNVSESPDLSGGLDGVLRSWHR
jgi:hypothetical protein